MFPGGTLKAVTADDRGDFSVTPDGPEAEGRGLVVVVAAGPAGNSTMGTTDVTIDTTPPAIDITSPDDKSTKNDPLIPVTGTSEPDTMVTIVFDEGTADEQRVTVTTDMNGDWSVVPPAPLADGIHTVSATATDEAGNVATDSVEFIIDTRAPDLAIAQPAEGESTLDTTPTIAGTAEPGLTVEVFVDGTKVGEVVADVNGDWTLELVDELTVGPHTVTATTRDMSGNIANDAVDFTVRAPLAPVTIDSPADGARVTTATPTITGTAEPGDVVTVIVDGMNLGEATADMNGDWSFVIPAENALSEGMHTVQARSGERTSEVVTVTVDTMGPPVMIETPEDGSTINDDTPTVVGTSAPGQVVTVIIDGIELGQATADANGSWTFEVADEDALADGDRTIEARVVDADGLESSDAVTVTLDATPPAVSLDPPVIEGDEVIVTGMGEPGAVVEVYIDGVKVGETVIDDDGTWEVRIPTNDIDPGDREVTVTATDDAGNSSGAGPTTLTIIDGDGETPEDDDFADVILIGGGCTSATGATGTPGVSWLLALVGLAALGRRRRRRA